MDTVELIRGRLFRVVSLRRDAKDMGLVELYMLAQTEQQRLKLVEAIERFADLGPNYNLQQVRKLKGRASVLIELKEKPSRLVGFYCPAHRGLLVLTHGFDKRSQETPKVEIDRALKLRQEYLQWIASGGEP